MLETITMKEDQMNEGFKSLDDYPEYDDFFEDIENNWKVFQEEALNAIQNSVSWHEEHLHNGNWNVIGLIWESEKHPMADLCPRSYEIVSRYSDIIKNSGFSIMKPKCVIKPHTGMSKYVLRSHLGLQIPEGPCGIRVDGETRHWREGEILLFDDMYLHDAWNDTSEQRVILLTDLKKMKGDSN